MRRTLRTASIFVAPVIAGAAGGWALWSVQMPDRAWWLAEKYQPDPTDGTLPLVVWLFVNILVPVAILAIGGIVLYSVGTRLWHVSSGICAKRRDGSGEAPQ